MPAAHLAGQILTADEMRAAEQALFDGGISISELMETAAGGAAEWVRRVAAGRPVTVLCGPGNNGGDGYVVARILRAAGNDVQVIAPMMPATDAARKARERWDGEVATSANGASGGVMVDCLFGSGLARPLAPEHVDLLARLAASHDIKVAIDLPSGVASDSGDVLNDGLLDYDLTLALGAWKFAHWSLPGRLNMGQMRLVPIGVRDVEGAAGLVAKPRIAAPERDSHKYRRGLLAVVSGAMPGAAQLAALAAQHAGAGYVKLVGAEGSAVPPDLVWENRDLTQSLCDERIGCVVIGPGLGRDDAARDRLRAAFATARGLVLDADALMVLDPSDLPKGVPILATPHDGELAALCDSFGIAQTIRRKKVHALAMASGIVICAKGPDTLIAAPDGRLAISPPATSWLSVAGSGDVLAGIAASRMAGGVNPFQAACEAVWLHGEAARLSGPAFTPSQLARNVAAALGSCL